ncbi:CU044_2847 family protein [Nocardia sp. NPDC046473]|uniref:CU044_2847 family protein n=1 Tax=Nocardia sp. NPDC046473 TaxID=3155733 RepID=UPI0033D12C49
MSELIRYALEDGSHVLIAAQTAEGVNLTSRAGKTVDAVATSLAAALSSVRQAAAETVRGFRDAVDGPENIEIEFGVTLSAEAGAIIARTGMEGHLKVTLTWQAPAHD